MIYELHLEGCGLKLRCAAKFVSHTEHTERVVTAGRADEYVPIGPACDAYFVTAIHSIEYVKPTTDRKAGENAPEPVHLRPEPTP